MPNELIKSEPAALPVAVVPSPGEMLQAVIAKGVTAENVAAVEQIVKLYEHMEERNAEKAFAVAFNSLQAEMPRIQAKKAVPNNDGTVRYRFAPYEEIMEQVRPYLLKWGFTVSFSTDFAEGRIITLCVLQHVGGFKRENKFAARVGSGPPKASEAQADGAASSYSKRFALCNALNIVCESDDDARSEGAPITGAQAEELQRRVMETESNEVAFLKFCGVTLAPGAKPLMADYERIGSAHYDAADAMLRRKEQQGR